jgi:hypothetical protein
MVEDVNIKKMVQLLGFDFSGKVVRNVFHHRSLFSSVVIDNRHDDFVSAAIQFHAIKVVIRYVDNGVFLPCSPLESCNKIPRTFITMRVGRGFDELCTLGQVDVVG